MKTYEVEVNGIKHTVQLTDEDAKARGLKAAAEPSNKARSASNKKG